MENSRKLSFNYHQIPSLSVPLFNRAPFFTGVSLNPQVMVGFHQPTIQQPMMPQIGVPIPIHQLNSYIMQQAKMGPPNVPTPRFMSARVMQEQVCFLGFFSLLEKFLKNQMNCGEMFF